MARSGDRSKTRCVMFLPDRTFGGSSGPTPDACPPTRARFFSRALLFALLVAVIGFSAPAQAQDRLGDMMGGNPPVSDPQSSSDEEQDTWFNDPVEQEPVYQPVVIDQQPTARPVDRRSAPDVDRVRPRQRPPAQPGEF